MIKVLLAEDMHMVRGALVALLSLEPDIEVAAAVASGDEIVPAAKRCRPDVAIIDVNLPGKDGLDAAVELHREVPDCRTLVLTSMDRPGTARRALTAQVHGFMLKDAPADKLAQAVRDVAAGGRVVDGQLALSAWDTTTSPLTSREVEILRLAADGLDPPEIAARLFLSVGTVRNHLTSVVAKVNARNKLDAIRIAREQDWI
ncbi:response regulator transcription factor [Saccharothrix hoggarensis]|uniref:DNA-binding response regulator n=1 Tax=Saccharothrix hoggarensis TaxID=913853 RepID=A0ABW3R1L1_9PSEU